MSFQVFSLVADFMGKAVCVFTAIMTSRKYRLYFKLFKKLREVFPNFNPSNIMSDYEASMRKALKDVFPNIRLLGCR